ncbi:MAG: signal recognition particle-docking protein FtsY [Alphaproteobacteria bacterium]|nr:signal recognition particle-docking protein FtsY [Alphaproteobacteria bacterium]
MFFWRKNKNSSQQEREEAEDRIVHDPKEPALEPPLEYDAQIDPEFTKHELNETENEVIDELEEIPCAANPVAPVKKQDDMGGGWLSRLTGGLSKSSGKIGGGLGDLFSKRKPDETTMSEFEDLLITADIGPATSSRLVEAVCNRKYDKENCTREVQLALAEEIAAILSRTTKELNVEKAENGPRTMLICGVNGVGKTTTIGKLAYQFHYRQHKKVMMAAGDTFRAAAIEQLQIWADRTKCPLISSEIGSDSAALAYNAYEKAVESGVDILMIDTAGRLHNKANLMAELEKISRVLKKKDEALPHEVVLVLDATTGQNAIAQVETFSSIVKLTGLVVTKLDGSAKGGIVVALADKFGLPVLAVGVGEDIEDLQPFHPEEFARTLVGLSN